MSARMEVTDMFAYTRIFFAFALYLCIFPPADAQAGKITATDRQAIRTMISNQIEAFSRDDGKAAYDYAAPAIQKMFSSTDRFMAMIREKYPPVYRARSVTFAEFGEASGGALQKVFLTGPNGKIWIAGYFAERQADGSWRISGCNLAADDSPHI